MTYAEKKRIMGLPFSFTKYGVSEEKIAIQKGFLFRAETEVFLYKIVDVRLERDLMERLLGLGTVVCYEGRERGGCLEHIRNAREIKAFITRMAEEERMKRLSVLVV